MAHQNEAIKKLEYMDVMAHVSTTFTVVLT
jgi:hypothetical protein